MANCKFNSAQFRVSELIKQGNRDPVYLFKVRFLVGIYEFLGATPRSTAGPNHKGSTVCSGHVECARDVFITVFRNHPSFHFSPTLSTMKVKFVGEPGMRQLEAIFGQQFWKFAFQSRHYNYIHFWEPSDRSKGAKFVLKWKVKTFHNSFPEASLHQERVYFAFKKRRAKRTLEHHVQAPIFVIPE